MEFFRALPAIPVVQYFLELRGPLMNANKQGMQCKDMGAGERVQTGAAI
jgi:hypothetical protein